MNPDRDNEPHASPSLASPSLASPSLASPLPQEGSSTGRGAYAEAGVDIAAGDALVDLIKPLARATARPGVLGGIGGFGALFDLKAAGFTDPILVAATDGVGTKLRLAIDTGDHRGIGIDLVAMCVNDLVVQGAQPLFFLDYFATGQLDPRAAAAIVGSVAEGCRIAGCALVGGETAEMPGLYAGGDYDLAGFAVGAAERGTLLPRPLAGGTTKDGIAAGDTILGLPSSGVHANGFSLVRRIVADAGLAWDSEAPFAPGTSLGAALLRPTRIYVEPVLALHRAGLLKAAAHITGGGLPGNLPRVLPDGTRAIIDLAAWSPPPVFSWLAATGAIGADEMRRVFNIGIGMALVVSDPDTAFTALRAAGEQPVRIGRIVAEPGPAQVVFSPGR